eukprot:CAMPEP_0195523794 /NCGR_PEP_ID=MMETSP0794_2-20130614/23214_1 /TAXON_ID=515487 /ORGANISM="Stephanopyxis turris, Strain CCMP 815" /LENGTH=189 /DNA_ID=CAMNT_0040653865 /DNA_START=114 /DNA_END=683 /DNA_ORIENTATION=-
MQSAIASANNKGASSNSANAATNPSAQEVIEGSSTTMGTIPTTATAPSSTQNNSAPGDTLVNAACTSANIGTISGKATCKNLCEKRACCFVEGGKYCNADFGKGYCDEYMACNILPEYTEVTAVGKKELVDAACTSAKIETSKGEENCQQMCSLRACCFVEGGKYCNVAFAPEYCEEFEACKNLPQYNS